jgi:SNF2 family DNA or RNA helicase
MPRLIDNQNQTLEEALKNTLPQTENIDILTGYFYFSGFSMLASELHDKKIRILIGRSIDPAAIDSLSAAIRNRPETNLDRFQSRDWESMNRTQRRKHYINSFVGLYNKSALSESFDGTDNQTMQLIFEEKLKNGSLEIRMTADDDHSKVYVLTNKTEFSANGDSKGIVFMGSSNFTYSGLLGQGELNQRFSDNQDYDNYHNHFERLWNDSKAIDIQVADGNTDFIDEIERRLWIHSCPAPYKIFIRILHEMYKQTNDSEIEMPDNITGGKFANLRYQLDAIQSAIDCIDKNNGVIIADVVGLGKSVIASAVARNLDIQRTFIIAPPHLKQQWLEYVQDFGIRGAIVESGGKIGSLHEQYSDSDKPALYIIDEAHRYRNELTEDYQFLHQLTRSNAENKVILLTATPYNNRPQDLFAMVKLFQTPSRSTIHSVDNLSFRFHELIAKYRKLEKEGKKNLTAQVKKELQKLSADLRLLIEPIIIRRSRIDLKEIKEYAEDLKNQGISFPEVVGPELVEYDLGGIRILYIDTLMKLTEPQNGFIGARYMSATYLVDKADFIKKYKNFFDETDLQTAQKNLAQFMKRLLVMRFESSKYAFKSTLGKMRKSMRTMIMWWEKGYVPILKKGDLLDPDEIDLEDLLDKIDNSDNEAIDIEAVKKIAVPIPRDMFRSAFIDDVKHDADLLDVIYSEWFEDDDTSEIGFDPKQECVEAKINALFSENRNRKIVIFSSFADTAEYVADNLKKHGFRALLYTGGANTLSRQVVSENFDASYATDKQKNDYDVIVATDALSEGFNLHRAGIVINYDIPFNPTRVVQRIGRINRINKKVFDKIYILNFFPTDVGAPITNVKNISTLKMLLINSIIGSDTKTLTPDEDLQSFFQSQYRTAQNEDDDVSWDNEFRNIYFSIRHDENLLREVMEIPERTRIVREGCVENVSVSFAKRGNGMLFAITADGELVAKIVAPEKALKYFKADCDEVASLGDDNLEAKFEILRKKIKEPHPLPKVEGRRADALKAIEYLKANYIAEKDYLLDLYETIKTFDDLSDGELKYIAQLNKNDLKKAVDELKAKFSPHYIGVIKERAEAIDKIAEIIMFTEDLRK